MHLTQKFTSDLDHSAHFQVVCLINYDLLRVFSDWVVEVKLLLSPQAVLVGHSLLFAVGAWPPHDGVRKARRLNLSRDLRGIAALRLRTLNEITSPIVPTGTTSAPPCSGGNGNSSGHAAAAFGQGCLPQRNSAPSLHIRCRITASLRATGGSGWAGRRSRGTRAR